MNLDDARVRLSCCRNRPSRWPAPHPHRTKPRRPGPGEPRSTRAGPLAPRPALDTFPRIVARSSLSRGDAATAVNAVVSAIADALESGETVNIAGFGRFATSYRAARQCRNPRTGETVAVPARTVATFKAGKALRDRLNG